MTLAIRAPGRAFLAVPERSLCALRPLDGTPRPYTQNPNSTPEASVHAVA